MSTQPPLSPSGPLDASSELPLPDPPLDASEPMPELLLPDPLLPLPELPPPLLLVAEPELPLAETATSPNAPSAAASAADDVTSPDLPPQPGVSASAMTTLPTVSCLLIDAKVMARPFLPGRRRRAGSLPLGSRCPAKGTGGASVGPIAPPPLHPA
jgi:hypothetical protein